MDSVEHQHSFSGVIGVSQRDITPPEGIYSRNWGAAEEDIASGVHSLLMLTCVTFQSMQTEMNKFRDYMRTAIQEARRANVLPGTVRETLRSKRLQSDAWDR